MSDIQTKRYFNLDTRHYEISFILYKLNRPLSAHFVHLLHLPFLTLRNTSFPVLTTIYGEGNRGATSDRQELQAKRAMKTSSILEESMHQLSQEPLLIWYSFPYNFTFWLIVCLGVFAVQFLSRNRTEPQTSLGLISLNNKVHKLNRLNIILDHQ